jgi:hypothetical protein
MSARLRVAVHLRTLRAFAGSAIKTGGSPARRSCILRRNWRPVAISAACTISRTECPRPVTRFRTSDLAAFSSAPRFNPFKCFGRKRKGSRSCPAPFDFGIFALFVFINLDLPVPTRFATLFCSSIDGLSGKIVEMGARQVFYFLSAGWARIVGGSQGGVESGGRTPRCPAFLCSAFDRDVAQPGSALAWGARGREFKSRRPDQSLAAQRFIWVSSNHSGSNDPKPWRAHGSAFRAIHSREKIPRQRIGGHVRVVHKRPTVAAQPRAR